LEEDEADVEAHGKPDRECSLGDGNPEATIAEIELSAQGDAEQEAASQMEDPESQVGVAEVAGDQVSDATARHQRSNGCLVGVEASSPDSLEIEAGSAKKKKEKPVKELKGTSTGGSSNIRSFTNAVICFIGSGVLGLPFAFRHVGVIGGLFGLGFITAISLHCMFLMVDSKFYLQEECSKRIKTYGDIGFYAFGRVGSLTVDFCIVLTQTGFCIAYLIFISESMREVMAVMSKRAWIASCMPLLVLTSWFRSLKPIAPLSLLAEVSISIALVTVLAFDVQELHGANPVRGSELPMAGNAERLNMMNFAGIPYFFGVAVYCFEGIGMVLPVMNSMKDPEQFKFIWGSACTSVALLYAVFGLLGYAAFGDKVSDLITTNMPPIAVTNMMKVSLCVGLLLTYPIMCFPVIELVEETLGRTSDSTKVDMAKRNALRAGFVLATGVVAYLVPKFGVFISLVGASASAALAFVLPSLFHLKLRFSKMSVLHRWREVGCILFGLLGGTLGTMNAIKDLNS